MEVACPSLRGTAACSLIIVVVVRKSGAVGLNRVGWRVHCTARFDGYKNKTRSNQKMICQYSTKPLAAVALRRGTTLVAEDTGVVCSAALGSVEADAWLALGAE